MALSVGSRLAHYDVTALIGEGAWARSIRPPIPSLIGTWPGVASFLPAGVPMNLMCCGESDPEALLRLRLDGASFFGQPDSPIVMPEKNRVRSHAYRAIWSPRTHTEVV